MNEMPQEIDEIRDIAMLTGMLNSDVRAKNSNLTGGSEKLAMQQIDLRAALPKMMPPQVQQQILQVQQAQQAAQSRPISLDINDIERNPSSIPPMAPLIPMGDILAGGIPSSLRGRVGYGTPPSPLPSSQAPQIPQGVQIQDTAPTTAQPTPQMEFGFTRKMELKATPDTMKEFIVEQLLQITETIALLERRVKGIEKSLQEVLTRRTKRLKDE